MCPVKGCLIWLRLHCLSRILVITWEIRILNFIYIVFDIFELRNLSSDQNMSLFFWVFLHYHRNSFKFKRFLIILRYIEKHCIRRAISGSCSGTSLWEMTFLAIGGIRLWPSTSKHFWKDIEVKGSQFPE